MMIQGLIDPKKKKEALAALDKGDTSLFDKVTKPKAVEPTMKLQLSTAEQKKVNEKLLGAAVSGNPEKVRALLDRGAEVNFSLRDGVTALMVAAEWGNTSTAEVLLSRGADVNLKDKNRNTALVLAVTQCHTDFVKLLIKYGAKE